MRLEAVHEANDFAEGMILDRRNLVKVMQLHLNSNNRTISCRIADSVAPLLIRVSVPSPIPTWHMFSLLHMYELHLDLRRHTVSEVHLQGTGPQNIS